MITRLHQQVAELASQSNKACGEKKFGKAVGLALAARATAVALIALQVLALLITPFRYIIQSFTAIHLARTAVRSQTTSKALSVWCRSDLALQFTGFGLAFGSVVSPELFCNKLQVHKAINHHSITMDIAMAGLEEKTAKEINDIVSIAGLPFDQKKFAADFVAKWLKNALDFNQKSTVGNGDIQATRLKSMQEALGGHFQEHYKKMKDVDSLKARENIKVKLLELVKKGDTLTPIEKMRLDLLKHLEPKAFEVAKRMAKIPTPPSKPTSKPNPASKPPAGNPPQGTLPKPIDPLAFLREVQEQEDMEAALKIQRDLDAQMAQDILLRDLLYQAQGNRNNQGRGRRLPTTNRGTQPGQIPRSMYASEAVYQQILNVTSMQDAVEKSRSNHDLEFSKSMFECQKKALGKLMGIATPFCAKVKDDLIKQGLWGNKTAAEFAPQIKADLQKKGKPIKEEDVEKLCKKALQDQDNENEGKVAEKAAEAGICTENEILSLDPIGLNAVWQTALYDFYVPAAQAKCKHPIWKGPVVTHLEATISRLYKQLKALKPQKSVEKLLAELLVQGKTPQTEPKLEQLRKDNKDIAKLVEELFVSSVELKEAKLLVEIQEELVHSIKEFENVKNYKKDPKDKTSGELLFSLLSYGETKQNKVQRDQLKVNNPKADEALNDVFTHVGKLVHILEKKLFNNHGIKNGVKWYSVFEMPSGSTKPVTT